MSNEKDIKTVLDEAVETATEIMTTEIFHAQLVKNTFELSKARTAYATEIADLQQEYDDTMDAILEKEHLANLELRGAREELEIAKENYELTLRKLKKERNEAGRIHNEGKAEAKNRWAAVNEEIQSKRHNIFERYRNSGGGTLARYRRTPAPRLDQRQERRNER